MRDAPADRTKYLNKPPALKVGVEIVGCDSRKQHINNNGSTSILWEYAKTNIPSNYFEPECTRTDKYRQVPHIVYR